MVCVGNLLGEEFQACSTERRTQERLIGHNGEIIHVSWLGNTLASHQK